MGGNNKLFACDHCNHLADCPWMRITTDDGQVFETYVPSADDPQ